MTSQEPATGGQIQQGSHQPPKVSAQSLADQRPAPSVPKPRMDAPGTGDLSTHSSVHTEAKQQPQPRQDRLIVEVTERTTPVDSPTESSDTLATNTVVVSSPEPAHDPVQEENLFAADIPTLQKWQRVAQGIQHFWEQGFWHDFFDPSKTFVSSFDNNFKRPVDPVLGDVHEVSEQPVERKPKAAKLHATFMDHVRDASIMNWKDKREADWQTAIFRWHSMLGSCSTDVQVVSQIFSREGFKEQAQVLVDIFYNKAPSTILKRCRSMSKMTNYFVDRGRQFPCGESDIYEFLCVERGNGAPSSRLKGYIEALTFCHHVLGVVSFNDSTCSRRCQGVAALDLNHSVRQADPLTVKQLNWKPCTTFYSPRSAWGGRPHRRLFQFVHAKQ